MMCCVHALAPQKLAPLLALLAESNGKAYIGLEDALALQDHAMVELMLNGMPPLRVGAARTLLVSMDGTPTRCTSPDCCIEACQGNRIEFSSDMFYSRDDELVHRRPTPEDLDLWEPYKPSARTRSVGRWGAAASDGDGTEGATASADRGPASDDSSGSSGSGSSGSSSSGNGSTDDSSDGSSDDSVEGISDAEDDEPDGFGGVSSGSSGVPTSCGTSSSSGSGDVHDGSAGSGPITSASSDGLPDEPDGHTWSKRIPMVRVVICHHKTMGLASKQPLCVVMPYDAARALHRWVRWGRTALMRCLRDVEVHQHLWVQPTDGRGLKTPEQFRAYWHKVQTRNKAPWLSFPPSAVRHIHIGELWVGECSLHAHPSLSPMGAPSIAEHYPKHTLVGAWLSWAIACCMPPGLAYSPRHAHMPDSCVTHLHAGERVMRLADAMAAARVPVEGDATVMGNSHESGVWEVR